ncbi:MAG TPA: hypothetical protein VGE11_02565 [Pseudonocardia sp.]
MDETTAPGSPHDLLLRLAGRVDDDLLADARELVAVGEDGHALELVTAALAAEGAALPPPVRAELVAAAHTARIDLDAETALAPPASDTVVHRFSTQSSDDASVGDAVRQLPERVRAGVRLRLAWRLTPVGSAPSPLPHPVLLVETPEGGRPAEVLAYQIAAALTRCGVQAAVEVLTSGRPMPAYHAAALRDSVPLGEGTPPLPSPPESVESVVAEVIEEVQAGRRTALPPANAPEAAAAPQLPDEQQTPAEPQAPWATASAPQDDMFAATEPAPRPVPMRAWPGGRRRRVFDEPADGQERHEDHSVTSIARPLPSPVPLARRVRSGPAPRPTEAGAGDPTAAAAGHDPLSRSPRRPLDPLLDPIPPAEPEADESEWEREWASGEWAMSEPAGAPVDAVGAPHNSPADIDTPIDGMAPVSAAGPAAPVPFGAATSTGSDDLFTSGTPVSVPQVSVPQAQTVVEPGLLKPESLARLSDADRELLARLQAELVASPSNGRGAHAMRDPGRRSNTRVPRTEGQGTGGWGPSGPNDGGPNDANSNGGNSNGGNSNGDATGGASAHDPQEPGPGGQAQPGDPTNPPDLAG